MRLFAAIDLDKKTMDKVTEIINSLSKNGFDVKWVSSHNLHITLKFLGEVSEDKVKEVETIMNNIVKLFHEFQISLSSVGFFGSKKRPTVIWIGLDNGKDVVKDIMNKMNKELSHVKKEDFEPRVHLTIGRVKSNKNNDKLIETINKLEKMKIDGFNVKMIKLKKSILTRDGPIYSDLKQFNLSKQS